MFCSTPWFQILKAARFPSSMSMLMTTDEDRFQEKALQLSPNTLTNSLLVTPPIISASRPAMLTGAVLPAKQPDYNAAPAWLLDYSIHYYALCGNILFTAHRLSRHRDIRIEQLPNWRFAASINLQAEFLISTFFIHLPTPGSREMLRGLEKVFPILNSIKILLHIVKLFHKFDEYWKEKFWNYVNTGWAGERKNDECWTRTPPAAVFVTVSACSNDPCTLP